MILSKPRTHWYDVDVRKMMEDFEFQKIVDDFSRK